MELPAQLNHVFCQLGPHDQYPWIPLPWKGVYNKVLYFDPITGATIELARVEKGCEFPEHYHTTVQTLFLVQGRLRTKDTVLMPGTFNVIPAGQVHGPFHAEEESLQFKYFSSVPVYILRDGGTFIYQHDGRTLDAGQLKFASDIKEPNFISNRLKR